MLKTALIAALALVCVASAAEARAPACVETGSILFPSCMGGDFLAGVKSIRVKMRRVKIAKSKDYFSGLLHSGGKRNHHNSLGPVAESAIGHLRPSHYIRGRLVCARNVNSALAERGIQGTGSALAHSFDHWGVRVPVPVVGAVAVTDRRGGGHVAIVSRVEGSRVFVFNPGRRGWTEREYTSRHARYRVAG